MLERVDAPRGAHDAVDLDQHGRLSGVLRVLEHARPRKLEALAVSTRKPETVALAEPSKRVAEPRVDGKRAVGDATGDLVIRHGELVVVLGQAPVAQGLVRE